MKTRLLLPLFCAAVVASAQSSSKPPEPGVPVVLGPAPAAPEPTRNNQRLYGPAAGQDLLVPPDVLNATIAKFRTAYGSPTAPRIVVYVNRELVDTSTGMKLTDHTENYEKTNDSLKTSGTNTYKAGTAAAPTLADKQTVREIERLFGRVFRSAGAKLADQKTAVDLLADKPDQRLLGDDAARQREALSGIADIAIEVLISSRNLTIPGISSDQSYTVPDIQTTAIRLKDSVIVGQASASDAIGRGGPGVKAGVAEITEATAIALMQDMLSGAN